MVDTAIDEVRSRRRFEVQQQIFAMREHQLLVELDGLGTSIWVFEQNYVELKVMVAQILSAQESARLTTRNNRMLFEAFITSDATLATKLCRRLVNS